LESIQMIPIAFDYMWS